MGFFEGLTLVLVVLKLTGTIDWSWWFVLLPEIIAFGIYAVVLILGGIVAIAGSSNVRKVRR